MTEKKTEKDSSSLESSKKSTDDKVALVAMSFVVDIFFSIFFIVLAYMAFWAVVVLSLLGFIVRIVGSEQPEELKVFSQRLATYISDCLNFSSNSLKEKPFPFGKFPD